MNAINRLVYLRASVCPYVQISSELLVVLGGESCHLGGGQQEEAPTDQYNQNRSQ